MNINFYGVVSIDLSTPPVSAFKIFTSTGKGLSSRDRERDERRAPRGTSFTAGLMETGNGSTTAPKKEKKMSLRLNLEMTWNRCAKREMVMFCFAVENLRCFVWSSLRLLQDLEPAGIWLSWHSWSPLGAAAIRCRGQSRCPRREVLGRAPGCQRRCHVELHAHWTAVNWWTIGNSKQKSYDLLAEKVVLELGMEPKTSFEMD